MPVRPQLSSEQKIEVIIKHFDGMAPHLANMSSLASLLGVAPSTVSRWRSGEVQPRGKQMTCIDLLHRTVTRAASGDEKAKDLLGRLISPAFVNAGLLGLGLVGILIAIGLDWLLRDDE